MSAETVDVAVIILTRNQRRQTLRCLESFAQVSGPSRRIVLWDNGSSDGTTDAVSARWPEVLVHHHRENAGVASGRNKAVQLALSHFTPRFLFFIDNDMTVTAAFLTALVAPFEGDDRLAQTTGKILDLDRPQYLYGAGGCRVRFWRGDTRHEGWGEIDRGQYDRPVRCIASGGCMLVRTEIFERCGGFDSIFDPYGPEDLDFGLRVVKAGFYGLYVPEAVVHHETRPGRTFEGGEYTELYATKRAAHWFIFMRRHASIWQQLGFYAFGAPYLLAGLTVREARKGNLIPAVRGLLRGFFGTANG